MSSKEDSGFAFSLANLSPGTISPTKPWPSKKQWLSVKRGVKVKRGSRGGGKVLSSSRRTTQSEESPDHRPQACLKGSTQRDGPSTVTATSPTSRTHFMDGSPSISPRSESLPILLPPTLRSSQHQLAPSLYRSTACGCRYARAPQADRNKLAPR